MSLILSNVGVGSWILLGVLLLILIVSPFIMRAKSKKEMDTQQKMMDAINKGDTVLTSAGVIGKVVGIDANKQGYKTLTLEIAISDIENMVESIHKTTTIII